MLWVFVLALIMPISLGSCADAPNLAQVTWAHAVNSQDALTTTFANGKSHILNFKFFSIQNKLLDSLNSKKKATTQFFVLNNLPIL